MVCDGLGSYSDSGIASKICADRFIARYKELGEEGANSVSGSGARQCFSSAERSLLHYKRHHSEHAQIGTTLAGILTNGRTAVLCHIGDTRIYRFTDGHISYVTKDHSVAQQMIDAAKLSREEIAAHPDQNKLLRSLGGESGGDPDITVFTDITPRDKFLICSDGFWTTVTEREMESVLSYYDAPSAALKCFEKCILGRLMPDHDNFSAILCSFHK